MCSKIDFKILYQVLKPTILLGLIIIVRLNGTFLKTVFFK